MTEAFTAEAHRAAMLRARIALDEATIGPSKAVLAEAPLLRLWQPLLMGRDVCLAGEVTGQPCTKVESNVAFHLGRASTVPVPEASAPGDCSSGAEKLKELQVSSVQMARHFS